MATQIEWKSVHELSRAQLTVNCVFTTRLITTINFRFNCLIQYIGSISHPGLIFLYLSNNNYRSICKVQN